MGVCSSARKAALVPDAHGIPKPSLEQLIESEDLGIEVLHPGGLVLTRELARLCDILPGTRVLEIACGTGESACLLAGELGARVTAVDASAHLLNLREKLQELEAEDPETGEGWLRLFQVAGFVNPRLYDRSAVIAPWTRETRTQLGVSGYLSAAAKVLRRWGASSLWRILAAERIFASPHLGYAVLVGHKPESSSTAV